MTKRRITIIGAWFVAATVCLGLGWSQAVSAPEGTPREPERDPATLLPVSSRTLEHVEEYERSRAYTGELEPRRASELGFDSSGLLVEVTCEEGDHVEAGQRLAHLDPTRIEARLVEVEARREGARARLAELRAGPRREVVEVARAALGEVEQELELARSRLARRVELVDKNAIAREALDEAERGVDVLEARLTAANSALEELLTGTREERIRAQVAVVASLDAEVASIAVEREKRALVAPFTGTIARRHLDEGAVVSPGQPIVRLVEDQILEVRIGVPLNGTSRLDAESPHTLQVGSVELAARVISILPELDRQTRTATVLFSVEAPDREVLAGQIAELVVTERISTPGFWLPVSALSRGERGLWSSFALIDGDRESYLVERRDVEVLHTNGDDVLVRGALRDGEAVIDGGLHRVVPGQRVRLAGEEEIAR